MHSDWLSLSQIPVVAATYSWTSLGVYSEKEEGWDDALANNV